MIDPPATTNEATASRVPAAPTPACQNCGAPLLGPHCYRCGQPVDGLVRHFSSIAGDFLDSVLNIDARVLRTLWPLFARPGCLSCEYFAGRRVRYVSPVRLFVFLSIVTFFIARLAIHIPGDSIRLDDDAIASATSVAQVETLRDLAIETMETGRRQGRDVPGLDAGIRQGQDSIRAEAAARIAALKDASDRGEPPPQASPDITFGDGKPWDATTNALKFAWLPGFANDWINAQVGHARTNIARIKDDPSLLKDALLGAIPSTLFVLLPVFALMLKVLYLFKRRLYMEHLIVALHSHAFLCLSLLLVFLAMALRAWLAPGALHAVLGWVEGLLFAWMPVYLLLMQKRVYGQGWPMTLFKYAVLGISYVILLSFGAAFTVIASVVWA